MHRKTQSLPTPSQGSQAWQGQFLHLDVDMDLCREMLVDEMHLGCALSMMETLLDRDNDQCP